MPSVAQEMNEVVLEQLKADNAQLREEIKRLREARDTVQKEREQEVDRAKQWRDDTEKEHAQSIEEMNVRVSEAEKKRAEEEAERKKAEEREGREKQRVKEMSEQIAKLEERLKKEEKELDDEREKYASLLALTQTRADEAKDELKRMQDSNMEMQKKLEVRVYSVRFLFDSLVFLMVFKANDILLSISYSRIAFLLGDLVWHYFISGGLIVLLLVSLYSITINTV